MPKSCQQDKFYASDMARFRKAFTADREWFMQWGDVYEPRSGDLLIHQDNGKKILIVAHMDYIVPTLPTAKAGKAWVKRYGADQPLPRLPGFGPYTFTNTGKWFPEDNKPVAPKTIPADEQEELSYEWVAKRASKLDGPVVDDRLGCALALGCTSWADVLFTDCEEAGRSTAAYFQAPRAYNWIVGFDRRGTDVVTYDYKDRDWLQALGEHFTVGHGSFSDIGYMEKLGTACVNMGIGYYNEHTNTAHWVPKDTEEQFARLYAFWSKHSDTQFHHVPPKKAVGTTQEPGRHQGKDQYSLHGREWVLVKAEEAKSTPPLATSYYQTTSPWLYSPRATMVPPQGEVKHKKVAKKKRTQSALPLTTTRYSWTPIADTVWDEFAADYRPISELDWDSPETREFLETFYPDLGTELAAWKAGLSHDIPVDPLDREYGYV